MESQPAPNILHDQPLNNVVKKDFYFCSKLLRSKNHIYVNLGEKGLDPRGSPEEGVVRSGAVG